MAVRHGIASSSMTRLSRLRGMAWKWTQAEVYHRDPGCVLCFSQRRSTIDHIVPRCCGGTYDLHNLQRLCDGCHKKKNKLSKQTHRLFSLGFLSEAEYERRLLKEAMEFQEVVEDAKKRRATVGARVVGV